MKLWCLDWVIVACDQHDGWGMHASEIMVQDNGDVDFKIITPAELSNASSLKIL